MTKKRYTHIVLELINELSVENKKLKCEVTGLKSELTIWKEDANEHIKETNKLFEENKQLKKELKTLWKYLKPFNNLARDYHLTYEQVYEITSEAIENGDSE